MQLEQRLTRQQTGTLLTRTQRDALRDRGRCDPVWWCEKILGGRLWSKQRQILESIRDNPRTAVRSAHSTGKSYAASHAALWWLYNHRPAVVLTTAPSFRQVRAVLWQEIRAAWHGSLYPLGGDLLETELRIDDRHFALGLSADTASAFQGIKSENMLVILDEASGVAPDIWTATEAVLTGGHARLLTIGNPTDPQGPFREEFRNPRTTKFHISAFDTPAFTGEPLVPGLVDSEWVEDKRHRWGEDSALYQARVLGDFPQQGEDTLIPLSMVEAAMARECPAGEPNILGVDVAWTGSDSSVIVHRRGPAARVWGRYQHTDPMELAGWVCRALAETGASHVNVDVIGIGAGVVARLRELGKPVTGVNVGEGARDTERFVNRRAEIFWALRERLQTGDIAIQHDEDLACELTAIRYKVTSRGQIQLEGKDQMRKRGLHSPDRADALALAFCGPSFQDQDFRDAFRVLM